LFYKYTSCNDVASYQLVQLDVIFILNWSYHCSDVVS